MSSILSLESVCDGTPYQVTTSPVVGVNGGIDLYSFMYSAVALRLSWAIRRPRMEGCEREPIQHRQRGRGRIVAPKANMPQMAEHSRDETRSDSGRKFVFTM
jgi:hypothetical protein